VYSLYAGIIALAVIAAPSTGEDDCGKISTDYTTAVAKVVDALRAYGHCVEQSNQRDDCAAQMQALDNAHDNFADAVADAKDCRQ
jgi:hypothetical protein